MVDCWKQLLSIVLCVTFTASCFGGMSLTVRAEEEFECVHVNTTVTEGKGVTCYEDGYTAGEQCLDCEAWISGHTSISAKDDDKRYKAVRYYLYVDGDLEVFGNDSIGCEAFYGNKSITKATLYKGITGIGGEAFNG